MAQSDQAAFATVGLGAVSLTLGDYANARAYLERGYQAFMELGNELLAVQVLGFIANLLLETGDVALAAAYCQRALDEPAAQTYEALRDLLLVEGKLHCAAANWPAARTTYERAYALSAHHKLPAQVLPIQAYLAAVDLAQGAVTAALAAIEPVLAHFATTPFMLAQRPQELLLIAYEILIANHDPRAQAVVAQAWAVVQEQAAQIDDPRLHESFLTQIPVNRDLARLVTSNAYGVEG